MTRRPTHTVEPYRVRAHSSPIDGWQTRAMTFVLTEIVDGVATLTLNNPDERNSLSAPMVDEIVAAMDAFEADESVGAVVVTGTPPAFCAGANLGNLAEADGDSLGTHLRGLPAHRPQPAADDRRRQRRRRRRRDEPRPRL